MRALVRHAFWPAFVLASTAAFAGGFAHGDYALTLAGVGLAQMILLLGMERVAPAVPHADAWRDPRAGQDLLHLVVGQGLGNQLGGLLALGGAALLAGAAGGVLGRAALWPTALPYPVQALLLVAVADGLETLRHRAEHRWAWLWPIHALHHSVDRLHVLKSGRGHALDMLLRHLVVFLPLALLGVPTDVLVWYPAAVGILGPIGHANVDVRLPGFAHKWLMTPQVHRLHHARAADLGRSNFCNVFPAWDRLFGTFADPARREPGAYGVEDDPMPDDVWGQLAAPFAWRRFTRRAA